MDKIEKKKNDIAETLESIEAKIETKMKVSEETMASIKGEVSDVVATVTKTEETIKGVSDDLEALNSKILALPEVTSATAEPFPMLAREKSANGTLLASNITIKAVNANDSVPGAVHTSVSPFATMNEANVFRGKATLFAVMGSIFALPQVGGISFNHEASIPGNPSKGGTLVSSDVVLKKFVSENQFSISSLDDVVGLDSTIIGLMMSEAGSAEAKDGFAGIKAGGFGSVNTGIAAKLPASADFIGKLGDLVSKLDTAYLNKAEFIMSREAYAVLITSVNNGLNFDPSTGTQTLFGYPLTVSGYVDGGNTAGHQSVVFGDFSAGLIIGANAGLTIGRFDQTKPGAITYYGEFRSTTSAWDTKALVVLKTAA